MMRGMGSQTAPWLAIAGLVGATLIGCGGATSNQNRNVPRGTVSDWRKHAQDRGRIDPTQKEDAPSIDALLRDYVNENLKTLREQAKVFRDPEWLKKQDASSAAVLHGVLADKSIRLLEVFGGEPDLP